MRHNAPLRTASTLALILALSGMARGQETAQKLQSDFRTLAANASRSVVAIHGARGRGAQLAIPFDAQAQPCGFFVDPPGHIITDARFIRGARSLEIRCLNNVRASAKLVGVDPLNGTALLLVNDPEELARKLGGKIPTLPFGRSADLQVGHSVFTVSNAFDSLSIDGTPAFSWGHVTSIGRAGGAYKGVVLETDASVNPGSFGGPLLDRKGRVVGVVTDHVAPSRWLGTAVPIDQIKLGVEDLLAGRSLTNGFIGVTLRTTGGEATKDGVEVVGVEADSPAASAGIAAGDRLLAVDGTPTYDADDLGRAVESLPPGSPLTLRLKRGTAARDVRVLLGRGKVLALADNPPAPRPTPTPTPAPTPAPSGAPRSSLGVVVRERTPQGGLKVESVAAGGPAAQAGVLANDVILGLNGKAIDKLGDLRAALDGLSPGARVNLKLERDGWLAELPLTLGAPGVAATPAPTPAPTPAATPVRVGLLLELSAGKVVVAEVDPTGPAATLGLRAGDALISADGRALSRLDDLSGLLASKKPGDKLKLVVERDGWQRDFDLTLAARR